MIAVRDNKSAVEGNGAGRHGWVGRRGAWAVRGEVMHRRDHLHAGHAVDRAVVQFQRHREGALRHSRNGIQPLDDGDLPRWATQIDLPTVQPCDLDAQLPPVTGLREPDVADVVFEIEVRIVHPVRSIESELRLGQASAKDIREM